MSAFLDASGGCGGCSTGEAEKTTKKKTSWPEVVGLLVEEAEKVIKRDMPEANIVVLPSGSPVTFDLRSDRVRVFVDTVARTPQVRYIRRFFPNQPYFSLLMRSTD
jgi:hypothetical protein